MPTVSEMMELKRERKTKLVNKHTHRALELKNKIDRANALNDFIPPHEWVSSTYGIYLTRLQNKINDNNLHIDDLLNEFPQLHRLTFFPCEYDFRNIREIIEGVFTNYLNNKSLDEACDIRQQSISIHYKQRELLNRFIQVIANDIITKFKSRWLFAEANAEMIINHQLYCNIGGNIVTRFSDWEGVNEAKKTLDLRLKSKERYQHNQQKIQELKTLL